MINFDTGLSKGYGFISYSSPEEANNAVLGMNGFRVRAKKEILSFFMCLQYD